MSMVTNIPGSLSVVTAPPGNLEIDQPFHFDNSGGLAVLADPVRRAVEHLLTIALTAPGERVMRPSFGVGVQRMIFDDGNLAQFQAAVAALQTAYAVSNNGLVNIQVSVDQRTNGVYVFQIQFQLQQDATIHQAVFDYTGALIGAT